MLKFSKNRKEINKKILPSLISVFIVTLFMSIGYSSYSTTLTIKDTKTTVRVDKNVRVTSVSNASVGQNNGGISQNENYNVSSIQADVRLPQSNSQVTYEVKVKNYGNVEVGIKSITVSDSLKNILDVVVTDYVVGDKLRDNSDACEESVDGCKLSIERTFYVTLKYKPGAYDSNNIIFNNTVVNFEFAEAHKVNYVGFTILDPPLQARSVLDGNTFSYNIGPYETLQVRMNGSPITNYTIDQNNLLTVPNVTGDLDIIIAEIMIPVDIVTVPSTATISYKINDIDQIPVTGELDTEIAIGSDLDIEVTCYGYKKFTKHYDINIDVDDTITLDQVYYLDIATIPADATIHYTVDGQSMPNVTGTLSEEYDPGTVISMTITKANYRTETRSYTMNNHISETISLTRQYTFTVNATPSDSSIALTYGGNTHNVSTGYSVVLDENTNIAITVSRNGYRTEAKSVTLTSDKTETFNLTKQYTYTINVSKPTDANISLKLNNGSAQSVSNGYSVTLDVGTQIDVTISKDRYISQTVSHTLDRDITDSISLTRLYSYKVSTNLSDANVKITYNGQDYTGGKTKTIDVEEGASVSWEITRDYYQKQTGSDSNIQEDMTRGSNMQLNEVKSASGSRSSNIGLGDTSVSFSASVPDYAKIVTLSTSGSFRVSVVNQTLTVTPKASNGHQFWSQSYKGKITSNTSVSKSYTCSDYTSNIDSCPGEGKVTVTLKKGSAVIVTINTITVTVGYIEK